MRKFLYTYKITLLKGSLAGHYYYGQHRTDNLNDGYAGSGRKIKDYFKHYEKIEGVTYVKEILHFYNDIKELNQAEYDLIGDKYKTDPMCLNLKSGGNQCEYSEETLNKFKNREFTSDMRKKMSDKKKGKHPWNFGLPCTTKGKHRKYLDDGSFIMVA